MLRMARHQEMQTTTVRHHLTPVRTAKISNPGNNGCWRGCGERGASCRAGGRRAVQRSGSSLAGPPTGDGGATLRPASRTSGNRQEENSTNPRSPPCPPSPCSLQHRP